MQQLPRTIASVSGFAHNACVCAVACQSCALPTLDGHVLPTRLVHTASPGSCLAACAPPIVVGSPAYALPLLAGELLEITVSGLVASHAGVPAEQAAVAATVRRALAAQGWPEAVMFMYVTTLEAAVELRPALLSTSKAWELDRSSSSWFTPGTISLDVHSQNWPAHESASFRVLSSRAAAEAHDVHELEAKLRSELLSAGDAADGAARARLLYRLGRAQELLGNTAAASRTYEELLALRGNGAAPDHVYQAYMVNGRERTTRRALDQGLLHFLAAYATLPERGVEALVEAAAACRQAGAASLARLFAFAAVAENQARLEDGRPVPVGAKPFAYDYLADEEAVLSSVQVQASVLHTSVLQTGLAAMVRLLHNDAAPRSLSHVWKETALATVERLKLVRADIVLPPQLFDVISALEPEEPICEVERVMLGPADWQNGCLALAGVLSPQLLILESLSGGSSAARLALSLGCDSYVRVRVPKRIMSVELRDEPATGEPAGRHIHKANGHACALAHVASELRGETLQVVVLQDDAPPPPPSGLSAVIEHLARSDLSESGLTLLGGDSLESSMHAYAVSVDGAERITRVLSRFQAHATSFLGSRTKPLLRASLHALLQPHIDSGHLLVRAGASLLPFALQTVAHRDGPAGDEFVVACIAAGDHVDDAFQAHVCEHHWLVPMLVRNATGLRVRLVHPVSEADINAHAILLLYSYSRAAALTRARQLSRSVMIVIAQELRQSGRLDVLTSAAESAVALPSIPHWLHAAMVLRHPGGSLETIALHPGLFKEQHAQWMDRPALAVHLWSSRDQILHAVEPALDVFTAAGVDVHVIGPLPPQHGAAPPLPKATRVVVSLTSIPPRIHLLPTVIAALLNQTRAPDAIYVTLPRVWARGGLAQVGDEVQRMARYISRLDRRIIVRHPDLDLGPALKLLSALEAEEKRVVSGKDVLILCVDDDYILPAGFVHAFVAAAVREPGSVIYRVCASHFYHDAARYDVRTFWLGCSLPEAWGGVLVPLASLRAAFSGDALAIRGLVARAIAHPACLRSDDYVFGEIYIRAGIRSTQLPADLQASMGHTVALADADGQDPLSALSSNSKVSNRYNACAQHLRELLDAMLPLHAPQRQRQMLPLSLNHGAPIADTFASYRFATARDAEQAVHALIAGAVPMMLNLRDRDDLESRVFSTQRVLCATKPSASFVLRQLALNASKQHAFFERPILAPGALEAVQALLADVSHALRDQLLLLCGSGAASFLGCASRSHTSHTDSDYWRATEGKGTGKWAARCEPRVVAVLFAEATNETELVRLVASVDGFAPACACVASVAAEERARAVLLRSSLADVNMMLLRVGAEGNTAYHDACLRACIATLPPACAAHNYALALEANQLLLLMPGTALPDATHSGVPESARAGVAAGLSAALPRRVEGYILGSQAAVPLLLRADVAWTYDESLQAWTGGTMVETWHSNAFGLRVEVADLFLTNLIRFVSNAELFAARLEDNHHDCESLFFWAHSLKDAGAFSRALPLFERRIALGVGGNATSAERDHMFLSHLLSGRIHAVYGKLDEAVGCYLRAVEALPSRRTEALTELATMLRLAGQQSRALPFAKAASQASITDPLPPADALYVNEAPYVFFADLELSIAAYSATRTEELVDGAQALARLLAKVHIPRRSWLASYDNAAAFMAKLDALKPEITEAAKEALAALRAVTEPTPHVCSHERVWLNGAGADGIDDDTSCGLTSILGRLFSDVAVIEMPSRAHHVARFLTSMGCSRYLRFTAVMKLTPEELSRDHNPKLRNGEIRLVQAHMCVLKYAASLLTDARPLAIFEDDVTPFPPVALAAAQYMTSRMVSTFGSANADLVLLGRCPCKPLVNSLAPDELLTPSQTESEVFCTHAYAVAPAAAARLHTLLTASANSLPAELDVVYLQLEKRGELRVFTNAGASVYTQMLMGPSLNVGQFTSSLFACAADYQPYNDTLFAAAPLVTESGATR